MIPVEERLWAKVEVGHPCGCWQWTGGRTAAGYGLIHLHGSKRGYVHRIAYEFLMGPIADGLQLDHLCRNRACVNPDHLEPVTLRENIRRSPLGSINRMRGAAVIVRKAIRTTMRTRTGHQARGVGCAVPVCVCVGR